MDNGGRWKRGMSQDDMPTVRRVSISDMFRAFTDNGRRGAMHARSIGYTNSMGTQSVNVRHRSGSRTELHMHGDNVGSIRHFPRRGDTLELRPRDMDRGTEDTVRFFHETHGGGGRRSRSRSF